MTEEQIKQKISSALNEPSVPQQLVERTVQRGKAIASGREAEAELTSGKSFSRDELVSCAAKGVVGRVMLNREMPNGVTAEMMAQQLGASEAFEKSVAATPADVLSDIRSGNLIKKTAEPAGRQKAPEPEKKAPVKGQNELSL